MGYPLTRGLGYTLENGQRSVSEESLGDLAEEMLRAREKFPNNRDLAMALLEEVGEAAEEMLNEPSAAISQRRREEWLQVACVAMRLYEEGDPLYESHNPGSRVSARMSVLKSAAGIGRIAKLALEHLAFSLDVPADAAPLE